MRLRRRRTAPGPVVDLRPLVDQIEATALDVERAANQLAESADRVRAILREMMEEMQGVDHG